MNEDVDDDAFAPFSYRRARDVIDDTRGTVSGQNVPSTSSTSRRVALVVASAHRALIAHENGSVCVLDVTNLAKRRWIRGRGRVAALALDGVGARALVADARGEIVVYALRARDDENDDEDDDDDGYHEVTRVTHDGAVTCAALEREYDARGGLADRGGLAYGDAAGGVYARVRTLLGHKIVRLSGEEDGKVRAMAWGSRNVLAWACDAGVKLYDVGRDEKVALVERPRGSPPAEAFAPRLTWNETSDNGKTLLVGWADCVKVVKIRLVDSADVAKRENGGRAVPARAAKSFASDGENGSTSDVAPGMSYVARVTSMFQTEYYVAGIQPFGDALAILAWSPDVDADGETYPEVRVVTRAGATRHIDVIATSDDAKGLRCDSFGLALAQVPLETGGFDRCAHVGDHQWWKPGREPRLVVRSPSDVVVGRATGASEYIDWLAKREDYVTLMDVCETASRYGHIDGTVRDIGHAVLTRAFDAREYAQTAALCSKLLRGDAAGWETWVEKFMLARQLPELQPYIPTEDPELSANTYEFALNAFLAAPEHHPRFLAAVKAWPARLYSPSVLIPVVRSTLEGLQTTESALASMSSVVLKEALAELYLRDGSRERALALYLDIGRPSVLEFIHRHELLPFVATDKLSLLATLDVPRAMSLFVRHRDVVPPSVVVPALFGRGGYASRALAHAYLSTLFTEDPAHSGEYHDTLFDLHREFTPDALVNFLKNSAFVDLARAAAALAGDDARAVARATALSKLGRHEDAVRALVNDAEDVQSAIALATELDDPIELWRVIVEHCAANATSAATLLARVKTLAGDRHAAVVIAALRDGVAIDRLKTRLIDIMDENVALKRRLRESHAVETRRAESSTDARAKIFARALRRRQIHISRRR